MESTERNFWKWLLSYCVLTICVISVLPLPDASVGFLKFLGIFGISPGIKIPPIGTLFIYPVIPLIIGILAYKEMWKYWHDYGHKFTGLSKGKRHLVILVTVTVFLTSLNINNLYFAYIGMQKGLNSVICWDLNRENTNYTVDYTYNNGTKTSKYNLSFKNLGNERVEFQVKIGTDYSVHQQGEIFIKDSNGENKTFFLAPKQHMNFSGEFIEVDESFQNGGGRFQSDSIVLLNTSGQHRVNLIQNNP